MLLVLFSAAINACALPFYYWDGNGNSEGAGSAPSGTWGVDPYWTTNQDGTIDTFAYDQRANVAFSAGVDAINPYTVSISNTQQVGDIHFDDGTVTLQGGFLDKDSPLISVVDAAHTAIINSVIISAVGTSNGITKYKMGTLILGGANLYRGPTTIEGGTLRLAGAQRLPSGSDLVLINGDTRTSDGFTDTPPTFDTGGYNQTLGALHLTNIAANALVTRTIDFGNGASALAFADSHSQDWQGLQLTVRNFKLGVDSWRFGTSASGLTAAQLGLFQFADFENAPGKISAAGFVTPVLPAPIVQSITKAAGTATIVWSAVPNGVYSVQYRDSLTTGTWTNFPNVTASGNTASYPDSSATPNHRFYRVAVVY
jgi:autotransporter-associated beta strand protein